MTCLDISNGEMICPKPDAHPWLTDSLANTGFQLALAAWIALALLALGLFMLWASRKAGS